MHTQRYIERQAHRDTDTHTHLAHFQTPGKYLAKDTSATLSFFGGGAEYFFLLNIKVRLTLKIGALLRNGQSVFLLVKEQKISHSLSRLCQEQKLASRIIPGDKREGFRPYVLLTQGFREFQISPSSSFLLPLPLCLSVSLTSLYFHALVWFSSDTPLHEVCKLFQLTSFLPYHPRA